MWMVVADDEALKASSGENHAMIAMHTHLILRTF
jgi:hypothetical protein